MLIKIVADRAYGEERNSTDESGAGEEKIKHLLFGIVPPHCFQPSFCSFSNALVAPPALCVLVESY